ncbi:DUF5518 domain-containing protein [Halogeometricum luteum]|uniref:DUF5518 domain-containing protein n=1 Tax=Halogeometricum luteum TaxID=2950537 RepID=A0ABU2FZN1_9EURY|nr:DUF5518 domain-containing protein [Halogeometricum sp. S3BR5-2]MDS0294003.1 DUF5518 domain-containing protein [Halogeometricum sp. S3BR5-2]
MVLSLRVRTPPEIWRFALFGAIASLPVTALLNWLPNSEATIGGGIMIFGAFIAGTIAAIRSSDPGAAGLRTGFVAGLVGLVISMVTVGTAVRRPLLGIVFCGLLLCVSSLFGLGFGRAGGWVATKLSLDSRRS